MTEIKTDLTHKPNLHEHGTGTGSNRSRRAIYKDLLPPCNNACPAGENIQAWLDLAQSGKYRSAWEKLTEENPMPAIHGRVCYHPCESSCNRGAVDTAVSIHAVERFLGDMAIKENWAFPKPAHKSGKKVLIVGAGPSGLSAAYHLCRFGHDVTLQEAGPLAGGMMHFGIPAYRLPRTMLQQEIDRILDMGITLQLNHKVTDLLAEKNAGNFDAIFIAIGAHIGKKTAIPARDASKILDAVTFLKEAESGQKPLLGRKVAIYGGGNTAMDAARTAKRMGAEEALIIYRRDREHMPAHDFEADEAMSEGIKIHWLSSIRNIGTDALTIEKMDIQNGVPVPTGVFETLQADALILALGQEAETEFLKKIKEVQFKDDGTVIVDEQMMTGYPGIFAGGDMVPSQRTVTIATGHGKKAARHINSWLREEVYKKPENPPLVTIEDLHVMFRTFAPVTEQAHLEPEKAAQGFDEIVKGLTETEVRYEAQRCLSCGNCFECDSCYAACPESAIIKLGPGKRYEINYDSCTGCAVCFEQCPCHAIAMIPEPLITRP